MMTSHQAVWAAAHKACGILNNDIKWEMGFHKVMVFKNIMEVPVPQKWEVVTAGDPQMNVKPGVMLGGKFEWAMRAVFRYKKYLKSIVVVRIDTEWVAYHDQMNGGHVMRDADLKGLAGKINEYLKSSKDFFKTEAITTKTHVDAQVDFIKSKMGDGVEIDTKNGWRSDYSVFVPGDKSMLWANVSVMGRAGQPDTPDHWFLKLRGFHDGMELDDHMALQVADLLKRAALRNIMRET